MNNLSGETTPRVTITHHYDDVLQQILEAVEGLREDLQPKPIVVRNAMNIPEGVSPQAVIQRLEEHGRRNHETAAREECAAATHEKAAESLLSAASRAPFVYRDSSAFQSGDPLLQLSDGVKQNGELSRQGWTFTELVLGELCDLLNNARRDGQGVGDVGGTGANVGSGGRRSGSVVGFGHDTAPTCSSCGCSDTAPAAGCPRQEAPAAGGTYPTDEESA